MFKYFKKLNYPIHLNKTDVRMAKYIISQLGGPNGELGAALRYFSQKYTMPDDMGKALLNDIACEELGHVEMICEIFRQLTMNASLQEMEKYGLGDYYVDHGKGIYPQDASGNPFSVLTIASSSDVLACLSEDMAAEQKARSTYENLINLTDDQDLIDILLFLRQREIIHYNRFKELFLYYEKKLSS